MTVVLVTGGVRSGKSALAERLFAATAAVTYLATGPESDDADWQTRVRAHQQRRPAGWTSLAGLDVAGVLARHDGPFLVDCLGTWTTASLDELGAWDHPRDGWDDAWTTQRREVTAAVTGHHGDVVIVTNEVGWGVVPAHRSGRIFADELGRLNQQIAGIADVVLLMVSGIAFPVKGALPPDGSLGAPSPPRGDPGATSC